MNFKEKLISSCIFLIFSGRIKDQMFVNCTHRSNQLIKFQNKTGTTLATTLLGRGDFSATETQKYINKLQQKLKFAPWSSKIARVGLCDVAPFGHPLAMLWLHNTTAVSSLFSNILGNFCKLYRRKVVLADAFIE